MTVVLSARVPDELGAWVKGYAAERGVTAQALLEQAVRAFRVECGRGVPVIGRPVVKRPVVPVLGVVSAAALARQAELNAAKERARGRG